MSDIDELSAEQVAELKGELEALLTDIEKSLSLSRDGAKPVDLDEPIGRLSRMDAMLQQSMTRAGRDGLEVKRRQIRESLAAMDRGEYGFCRRCEEPIAFKRLKVRPEAAFCVACQERLERRE
jgi:DnaK suppressor protein